MTQDQVRMKEGSEKCKAIVKASMGGARVVPGNTVLIAAMDAQTKRADEAEKRLADAVAAERSFWVSAAIRILPEAKYFGLMNVAAELRELHHAGKGQP